VNLFPFAKIENLELALLINPIYYKCHYNAATGSQTHTNQ